MSENIFDGWGLPPPRDDISSGPQDMQHLDYIKSAWAEKKAWAWEARVAKKVLAHAGQEGLAGRIAGEVKKKTGTGRLTLDGVLTALPQAPTWLRLVARRLKRSHQVHVGLLFEEFRKTSIAKAYARFRAECGDKEFLAVAFGPVLKLRGGILVVHSGTDSVACVRDRLLVTGIRQEKLVIEPLAYLLDRAFGPGGRR